MHDGPKKRESRIWKGRWKMNWRAKENYRKLKVWKYTENLLEMPKYHVTHWNVERTYIFSVPFLAEDITFGLPDYWLQFHFSFVVVNSLDELF